MSDQPPLEEFLAEAEAFLDSHYARRAPEEGSRFQWGEGSDEVRVFQEPDPVEEAEALPRIRGWRAALWGYLAAGVAWMVAAAVERRWPFGPKPEHALWDSAVNDHFKNRR